MAEPAKKVEEISQESMEKLMFGKNRGTSSSTYESQNVDDLIFEFFDEQVEGLSSWDSSIDFDGGESVNEAAEEEEEEEQNGSKAEAAAEAAKAFWDSQEELLLATLRRTTSLESRIRKATKEALVEMNSVGFNCLCRKSIADGCWECRRKQVCDRIQKAGFSCTICKSKWKKSPEKLAGEHTYLEVTQNSISTSAKSDQVKVIIELNFKSEFKMAKACEEYDRLINRLPDVFVGKLERLKSLIKILCGASKKCMKDKKMHMAPWRKHKYMQAKWLGKPDQKQSTLILPSVVYLERSSRPKASMLTFDLLDTLPSLHQATMIRVV